MAKATPNGEQSKGAASKGAESKSAPNRGSDDTIVPADAQSEAFVKGLVANGQAAKPAPDGTLPSGATHEIVGETAAGVPILKRRRFSAF